MLKWRLPERNRNFYIFEAIDQPNSRNSMIKQIRHQVRCNLYVALVGLSGAGKTSLAVEYVYRFLDDYDEIFFLQGSDLLAQLKALVSELYKINTSQSTFTQLLNHIFQAPKKRIFILDDAVLNNTVHDFFNYTYKQNNVSLLVTSNSQHWETIINVGSFREDESEKILMKYFPNEGVTNVHRLIQCLGGLPLAIVQAIVYIKSASISVHDYLNLFEMHPDILLAKNSFHLWKYNYPYSAYKALLLNLQKIKAKDTRCFELLEYCVFFHYENIPKNILSKIIGSELELNDAMIRLLDHSLVTVSDDKQYFSLHCLLQKILLLSIEDASKIKLLKKVLSILHDCFFYSRNKPQLFRTFLGYFLHLDNILRIGEQYLGQDSQFDKYYCLLNISMGLHQSFEKHDVTLSRKYLTKSEKIIAQYHVNLPDNILGILYNGVGHNLILEGVDNPTLIEHVYTKALSFTEHLDLEVTAYSYSGLAIAYFFQKHLEKAIVYNEKATTLIENTFGEPHIDIPHFRYRSALIYFSMRDIQTSKTLCLSCVNIGKQLFLDGLNFDSANAALLLGQLLENEEASKNDALTHYQYAHNVLEKLIGQEHHPEVLLVKNRLENLQKQMHTPLKKHRIINVSNKSIILSKREMDCLGLVQKGYSSKMIANILYLSPRTVESHINNIKHKFNCKTKLELLAIFSKWEVSRNLPDPPPA